MPNNNAISLPDHLAPLLQPTPSGVAKLVAAWDGLGTESQIFILMELDKVRLPAHLNEKIRIKALDSANAYVRYLAAKGLYFSGEDREAIRQRIEEDPDPLVQYCLMESEWQDLKDADGFFALPHEARLAKVRLLKSSGDEMATLIAHAIDHHFKEGKISEIALLEILADYVNKPSFREHYNSEAFLYDGLLAHLVGKDIEALWRLILKLPERISYILIEKLPPRAGSNPGIPTDILQGMSDWQLERLFCRDDIDLRDFRKKIFFDTDETHHYARGAAIRHNFDLEYAEFATVLTRPEKEKVETLVDLAFMARDLSLCLYEAIGDILSISDVNLPFAGVRAQSALERKLEELKGDQRERQLRELRLYRLAKEAVSWKKGEGKRKGHPPSGELEFLAKSIVEADTWDTFMAFSKAWDEDDWRAKKLENHLPRIYEAGEKLGYDLQKETKDEQLTKAVARLQMTQDDQTVLSCFVIVWLMGILAVQLLLALKEAPLVVIAIVLLICSLISWRLMREFSWL